MGGYKVSIIIPLYNVCEYVENSLYSALNQSFRSVEYILVNDCSTDNTMDVVNSIVELHPRKGDVKIIHHLHNRGLSAARNTGMIEATGEYIFFMDSDDELSIDCIQLHYDAITEAKSDFTVANIQLVGAKSVHVKNIEDINCEVAPVKSYLKRQWSVSAWNKLYRRDFLLHHQLHFENGLIHEDVLWSYMVSSKASKVAFVKEATYIYKIRKNSITTQANSPQKIDSLLFILNSVIKDIKTNHYYTYYSIECDRFISFWAFNTALLLLNFNGDKSLIVRYYQILQQILNGYSRGIYGFIMKMPYRLFCILVKPVYNVYKRMS